MTVRRRDPLAPAVTAPAFPRARSSAGSRPNIIIFLIVHDLGTALGLYGDANVRTPHLDEFAALGIMTGRYAHTTGLIGLANINRHLPDAERTLVDCLNDAGFETVNIGGQHERLRSSRPNANRYRELGPAHWNAGLVAEDVCRFLERWKPAGSPLYLNVYVQDLHAPWNRPEFQGRYRPGSIVPPPFLPNTSYFRRSPARFYGAVSFTDAACGWILDTIRETGLENDSLVIITTGHGTPFPAPGARCAIFATATSTKTGPAACWWKYPITASRTAASSASRWPPCCSIPVTPATPSRTATRRGCVRRVFRDIPFDGNTFIDCPSGSFFLSSASNVILQNNVFGNANSRKLNPPERAMMYISYASGIHILNNRWVRSPYVPSPGAIVDTSNTRDIRWEGNTITEG